MSWGSRPKNNLDHDRPDPDPDTNLHSPYSFSLLVFKVSLPFSLFEGCPYPSFHKDESPFWCNHRGEGYKRGEQLFCVFKKSHVKRLNFLFVKTSCFKMLSLGLNSKLSDLKSQATSFFNLKFFKKSITFTRKFNENISHSIHFKFE